MDLQRRFRWLAATAVVMAMTCAVTWAETATLTATLTDDRDARIPQGGLVTFELRDLAYEATQGTGEWPDPGAEAWTVEWSLDGVTWVETEEVILWTPLAEKLMTLGPAQVRARVTFSYTEPPQGEDPGTELTAGPTTFTRDVNILGVQPILYSLDGGATYDTAPATLVVGVNATVYFKTEPEGGPLFPVGLPTWLRGTTSLGSGQLVSTSFETVSPTAEATVQVSATCGTSTQSVAVVTADIDKVQWRLGGDAEFTDVTGPLFVPAGSQVAFKAVVTPTGVSLPEGRPLWTNATPDASDPLQASATVSVAAAADQYYTLTVVP